MLPKHKRSTLMILIALAVFLLVSGGATLAAGGYSLPWWTVDSGGGQSTGGGYALTGTLGQPDTGTLSNGRYSVNAGFWNAEGVVFPTATRIYLPTIIR